MGTGGGEGYEDVDLGVKGTTDPRYQRWVSRNHAPAIPELALSIWVRGGGGVTKAWVDLDLGAKKPTTCVGRRSMHHFVRTLTKRFCCCTKKTTTYY